MSKLNDFMADPEFQYYDTKVLSENELLLLEKQNSRMITPFLATKLDNEAKKHWDLFYKRNETRFFKDRHWTTREFRDLSNLNKVNSEDPKILFEIGCGVGNFIFPLLNETTNVFVYACDLSTKAIELLKQNINYDSDKISSFQADITETDFVNKSKLNENNIDVCTMIFVLSAIHPEKFDNVLKNIFTILKAGGVLLFRDYGLYDMAQLRFKPGHKISENFYMRQNGTRSYFFSLDSVTAILQRNGFEIKSNYYVHRRTVNFKEGVDVPRIFVQTEAVKPF